MEDEFEFDDIGSEKFKEYLKKHGSVSVKIIVSPDNHKANDLLNRLSETTRKAKEKLIWQLDRKRFLNKN